MNNEHAGSETIQEILDLLDDALDALGETTSEARMYIRSALVILSDYI